MRCAETKRLRGEATGALRGEFLRFAPAGNLSGACMCTSTRRLHPLQHPQGPAVGSRVRLGSGWQQLLVE